MFELSPALWRFVDRGGEVLWVIGGLSLWLWTLLLDRALFVVAGSGWVRSHRNDGRGWSRWVAECFASRMRPAPAADYERNCALIASLVSVLPLVGLLGTVVGMIRTFDVLSAFGASNPRGLSAGISEALLTTMAGLVTSLAGLLCSQWIEKHLRAQQVAEQQQPELDPWAFSGLLRLRSALARSPLAEMDPEDA